MQSRPERHDRDRRRSRAARHLLLEAAGRTRAGIALLALVLLAEATAATLLPGVLGRAVDAALGRVPGATAWVAVCAALVALLVACEAAGELAGGLAGVRATAWLRRRLCRHLLAAGPAVSGRLQDGEVVSRLVRATTDAGRGPAAGVSVVAALIPAVGAPVALALIDPRLAVAFLAGTPLLALILRTFVRDTAEIVARYQRAQAAIAARLLDALGGARTIAAAAAVERESARVLAPLGEVHQTGRATWRTVGRVSAQAALFAPLLQVVVLATGGLELAAGRVTPGGLLAAAQYAVLGSGIGAVIGDLGRLGRARAGAGLAVDLLTVPARRHGQRRLPPGNGQLELRGVTVRRDGEPALDRLDLVVPAGVTAAIVGRSGSGKSLVAALAGRLLDPDEGQVLLDGVPLPELARDELRRAVGCAFARPALLGGTVGGAIGFGAVTPPERQVVAAARAACADGFIRRLPDGYDTPLPEAPMSGGEVQRIGLARVLAHAPGARLLVLDDATSSLDTATELEVGRALTGRPGQTRLIVAHRAATVARAQLVVWLDGGRLRATGSHRELLRDAAYRAVFGPQ